MREPKGNIGTVLVSGPFGRVLKPVRFQRAQAGAWDLQRAELSRPVRMKAVGLAVVGLSLVLLQCCGGRTTAPTEDPGETTTSATTEAGTTAPTTPTPGAEPTIIIDASAPAAWVEDFNGVMENLKALLTPSRPKPLTIRAWLDTVAPPAGFQNGQYLTSKDGELVLALEISSWEIEHQHDHRLSVIAHEYFHWYQHSLHSGDMFSFQCKWMIEGAAGAFESMYLAEYYDINTYFEDAQLRHIPSGDPNPAEYELYSTSETNYGYSVYMMLILAQHTSFQKVFVDFWEQAPQSANWKDTFSATFGMSVDAFYDIVRTKPDKSSLIPSQGTLLTVQF